MECISLASFQESFVPVACFIFPLLLTYLNFLFDLFVFILFHVFL